MVAAALAGSAIVGSVVSSSATRSAGKSAANATSQASEADIAERRRQFDSIQQLLSPYVNAGTGALSSMQSLLGLNGGGAQQQAISALEASPAFTSLLASGENAIRQNASATGGLRGGNTQAALAQYRPALLAQTINDQYSRLGGLVSVGQNAAAGVGNAGIATSNGIGAALQSAGAGQAAAALSGGAATAGLGNGLASAAGLYAGLGGFRGASLPTLPNVSFGADGAYYGGLGNSLSLGADF